MTEQNYQNHTKWNPLVHFVTLPLLLILLVWSLFNLTGGFDWNKLLIILIAVILVLININARLQALKVQDRVIRLEERLRYKELLSPETLAKTQTFRTRHLIALRFASDDELPQLIEQIDQGKLNTSKEIKQAIKNWRSDHFRA